MRALVWRYVASMHRQFEESEVTEDDINEVKGEITSMRYELLEVLEKNGMDVSSADRKEKSESRIFFGIVLCAAGCSCFYTELFLQLCLRSE
jgi:hypothetical protein